MAGHDDKTLLERAHEKQVYRFGLRMYGSEDAAREVLQQTLLTAFRSLHDFRGDAKLSTWLYQIARTFCGKAHRRRVDEPVAFEGLETAGALSVPAPEAAPEARAQARELAAALEAAVLALPEKHREALILRDVEGLTAEEAAQALGIQVRNLKTRLHRARMELRQHLATLRAWRQRHRMRGVLEGARRFRRRGHREGHLRPNRRTPRGLRQMRRRVRVAQAHRLTLPADPRRRGAARRSRRGPPRAGGRSSAVRGA